LRSSETLHLKRRDVSHPGVFVDGSDKLPPMSDNSSEIRPLIMVDGAFGDSVSALDRGLAYGDGLFETCRVIDGQVPLWALHLDRLQRSCERLALPLDNAAVAAQKAAVLEEAGKQQHSEGVLKLLVTRGQGGRGYRPPADPEPMLCWQFHPGEKPQWRQHAEQGITLRVCRHRLSDNPLLAGMKHLSRLDYVLARSEWRDEFAEGLLLDQQNRVIEGTVSNVFLVKKGQLLTPALDRNGVAGVMRRLVMEELAAGQSLVVREADIGLGELQAADEVFVANSVFGLWPVVELSSPERLPVQVRHYTIGPVTRALQKARANWLAARI